MLVLTALGLAGKAFGQSFVTVAPMATPREEHSETRLSNGLVLVAGGVGTSLAELYDPATQTWSPTGSLSTARDGHTATLLPSGQVLSLIHI